MPRPRYGSKSPAAPHIGHGHHMPGGLPTPAPCARRHPPPQSHPTTPPTQRGGLGIMFQVLYSAQPPLRGGRREPLGGAQASTPPFDSVSRCHDLSKAPLTPRRRAPSAGRSVRVASVWRSRRPRLSPRSSETSAPARIAWPKPGGNSEDSAAKKWPCTFREPRNSSLEAAWKWEIGSASGMKSILGLFGRCRGANAGGGEVLGHDAQCQKLPQAQLLQIAWRLTERRSKALALRRSHIVGRASFPRHRHRLPAHRGATPHAPRAAARKRRPAALRSPAAAATAVGAPPTATGAPAVHFPAPAARTPLAAANDHADCLSSRGATARGAPDKLPNHVRYGRLWALRRLLGVHQLLESSVSMRLAQSLKP